MIGGAVAMQKLCEVGQDFVTVLLVIKRLHHCYGIDIDHIL